MPPSTFDVNWYKSSHNGFLDISRSNGGLRISDYYYYYKYHWLECYHHIVAGALYKNLDLKCWTVQYRRDCWIGQLSCLLIFSTSWSLAAFLHRAGGSMLESTGSHGRGVDRRVPEMHYWLSEIQHESHEILGIRFLDDRHNINIGQLTISSTRTVLTLPTAHLPSFVCTSTGCSAIDFADVQTSVKILATTNMVVHATRHDSRTTFCLFFFFFLYACHDP